MTDLSPAARAVFDAWIAPARFSPPKEPGPAQQALAAALRAAAELLSQEVEAPKVDGSKYAGLWHSHDYLNAIAAELEGANG